MKEEKPFLNKEQLGKLNDIFHELILPVMKKVEDERRAFLEKKDSLDLLLFIAEKKEERLEAIKKKDESKEFHLDMDISLSKDVLIKRYESRLEK